MSLILLNALLILIGPFVVVAPAVLATVAQFSAPRRGFRRPVVRVRFVAGSVAW